jgi:hypothetical protein
MPFENSINQSQGMNRWFILIIMPQRHYIRM